ncbi:MAG: ribosome assembly factor SBDS [Candidatus Geothermarchaeales archaeon]
MAPDYTVARYYAGGKRFEVLVDPDKALEYKMDRRMGIEGVLMFETIYSDSKKGMKASKEDILEAFGTIDVGEIAGKIVKDGEVLIKTEQRRALIEEKRKQIISYISRHCIDARTNAPLPPVRIEKALGQIDVKINPFGGVEEQAPEIIKKLSEVIPIRQQTSIVHVKIPAIYVGKAFGFLKKSGGITEEKWLDDGSYWAVLALPAGLMANFMERLGDMTKGTALIEVIEGKKA